jgi:hypothetical protein
VNSSEIELLRFDIDIDNEEEDAIEEIIDEELYNNFIEEEFKKVYGTEIEFMLTERVLLLEIW